MAIKEKSLISKIKEKGIKGIFGILHAKFTIVEYAFFSMFPLNNRLIVFESDGDLTDNSYALYEYMRRRGLLNKYEIVWMVHDISRAKQNQKQNPDVFPNTVFSNKDIALVNLRRSFYLATCKWFIYDHSNLESCYFKRKGQQIIFISHGFGVKAGKGIRPVRNNFDINIVLGEIPAENAPKDWGGELSQTRQWGYPRNDYLFVNDNHVRALLNEKYSFNRYKKVLLWMPTFRKAVSYGKALSEEYIQNETGMPLFRTIDDLKQFDSKLAEWNNLVVLKLHPLQADLDIFSFRFSNIVVIHNEDIQSLKIQLYQLIRCTDALLTDYSSVSTDYMLLNKPIVYIIDDYEEYKEARGFSPENALDFLVGYHVTNIKELEISISEINQGVDRFQEKRNKMMPTLHKYPDGNASERIVKHLCL